MQKYEELPYLFLIINNSFSRKTSSFVSIGTDFVVILTVKPTPITMKKLLIITLFALMAFPMMAQSNDKKPGINKENCTFTNKDGKTFNLYGKWQVVESFPDIKVQIVESFPDLEVKVVESFPDQCGKVKFVESFPDVKVQFVNSFPDIKIKFVDSFPGVKK